MKMTMHIDEELLSSVMEVTGAASKTEAVRLALTNIARRARFKKLASAGFGLSSEELKSVFEYPEEASLRVAEEKASVRYGSKRSSR